MFPISPVYVSRQYAAAEGIYRVHAASRASPIQRSNGRLPFDMIMDYHSYFPPKQGKKDASDSADTSKHDALQEQENIPSNDEKAPILQTVKRDSEGLRSTDGYIRTAIANSYYSDSKPKPYSPYGRFRELGYDAGNLPPRALAADRQIPYTKRYDSMVNAYRPPGKRGSMLYSET